MKIAFCKVLVSVVAGTHIANLFSFANRLACSMPCSILKIQKKKKKLQNAINLKGLKQMENLSANVSALRSLRLTWFVSFGYLRFLYSTLLVPRASACVPAYFYSIPLDFAGTRNATLKIAHVTWKKRMLEERRKKKNKNNRLISALNI